MGYPNVLETERRPGTDTAVRQKLIITAGSPVIQCGSEGVTPLTLRPQFRPC